MTDDTPAAVNSSGTDASESDIYHLGTDAEAADHYHDLHQGRVLVVPDEGDDPEHVEALDGRPVSEWVQYVEEERGWIEHEPVGETNGVAGMLRDIAERAEADAQEVAD